MAEIPQPEDPAGTLSELPPSVRAQLLATEHWGLLASRSTAQSEVLTRISMFLTLVSAALVSLALVGQATRFSDAFIVFAVAVLGIVVLVGVLTHVRVVNVGLEDLMYVLAMNRLRAAYVEMDPGVSRYLMSSPHDDRAGSKRTYDFFERRSDMSHLAGSSMMFIAAVDAALIGLFVAAIAGILSAPTFVAVIVGAICGVGYFVLSSVLGARGYYGLWSTYTPVHPSPPPPLPPL
ncbi:MAG: hypothetical protein JWQ59_2015 [Cryobacterium sp.]|jgi:hypothetical protein|nr:hypothetical protein [Cryobacterium sp.]